MSARSPSSAWPFLLTAGVWSIAWASGDPLIIIHFGLGFVTAIAVLGFALWEWRRARIHGLFILFCMAALSLLWWFCWTATDLSNLALGSALIGVPLALAVVAKALANHGGR